MRIQPDRQGQDRIASHGTGLSFSGKGRSKKNGEKRPELPQFPRQDTLLVAAVVIGKPLFDLFPTHGTVLLVFGLKIGPCRPDRLTQRPIGCVPTNGHVRGKAKIAKDGI
jgi:hypothetical protein